MNHGKQVWVDGQGPVNVTMCPPGRAAGALPFDLLDDEGSLPISDSLLALMRRQGACEDDCEIATTVDGDHREELDVFFSRPLRLRSDAIDRAPIFDEGFEDSVLRSLDDRRRAAR